MNPFMEEVRKDKLGVPHVRGDEPQAIDAAHLVRHIDRPRSARMATQ